MIERWPTNQLKNSGILEFHFCQFFTKFYWEYSWIVVCGISALEQEKQNNSNALCEISSAKDSNRFRNGAGAKIRNLGLRDKEIYFVVIGAHIRFLYIDFGAPHSKKYLFRGAYRFFRICQKHPVEVLIRERNRNGVCRRDFGMSSTLWYRIRNFIYVWKEVFCGSHN